MGKIRTLLAMVCVLALSATGLIADGRKPGSVLVYPVHRADGSGFTILSVTNTDLQPMTPISLGGSTNVHFDYYNVTPDPTDPTQPLYCDVFDRVEFLSPADTLSVMTMCHNPVMARGYVVVTAEDPSQFRTPWSHDRLVGSVIHFSPCGFVCSVPAIPFRAVPGDGLPTDLDGDLKPDFDGVEYERPADIMMLDQFIGASGAYPLALVDLEGDLYTKNSLYFAIWNDNEVPLSTTMSFSCWTDIALYEISPLFSDWFLASLSNAPDELDIDCDGVGDVETGWMTIQSHGLRRSGGLVDTDGAFLAGVVPGVFSSVGISRLLWESRERQPD